MLVGQGPDQNTAKLPREGTRQRTGDGVFGLAIIRAMDTPGKRKLSAEARAKLAAAQKARWAKAKVAK